MTKEKEQNEKEQHQEYEKLQAQFEALNQKLKEVEKQNNRFRLIYGNYDCVEQKDIKALQVALNLSQNKPCNISDDREDIKHWLNLSRNGFADKLHKTYPMLDKTFLDICYLAALGLSIDEIAHPFSEIVGKILNLYPEEFEGDSEEIRGNLYELGYSLGKWIYIIDALDDLKEDMEKNKFNPINYLYNTNNKTYEELMGEIRDRMEFTIFNCGYTCRNALEKLPIKRNKEILENIISLGMMDKYTKITNECECNKRSGKNESI